MSREICFYCSCGYVSRHEPAEADFSVVCAECGEEVIYEGENSFRLETDDESFLLIFETHEVGREGAGRIVFDEGQISRHHCTLKYVDSGYTIVDEGSLNGTFVNGRKLRKGSPVRLHVGDAVRIWQIELRYWGPIEEISVPSARLEPRARTPRRSNSAVYFGAIAVCVLLGAALVGFLNSRQNESDPLELGDSYESDRLVERSGERSREGLFRNVPDDDVDESAGGEFGEDFDGASDEDLGAGDNDYGDGSRDGDGAAATFQADVAVTEVAVAETSGRSGSEDGVSPEPAPLEKTPSPPAENRLFSLSLKVYLDGEKLDPKDQQSFARVGYFLQHESGVPYFLIFPDGKVKRVEREGGGADGSGGDPFSEYDGKGDLSRPTYRIRMKASTTSGNVKFYDKELMKKFECELICHLEKREKSGKFSRVRAWKFRETLTRAVHDDLDESRMSRQAFYQALETLLTQRFKEVRLFAFESS